MPIDFSYLEGAAPQEESTPVMSDTANVTIRVDADSMLVCDGDYIDQPFKAAVLTKIQLPIGQHLLEFLYAEDPKIKIEKEVDFPEAGKSYLVITKGLKDLVDAAAEEAKRKAEEEAKRKAEEEAKRKAEEEAKRKAEEEAKRKAEEEAKRKAEEEAKRKAEEEAKRLEKLRTTINGHKFVDLGLPSGLRWATCNIGANSPEEYGDHYAWGEVETKPTFTKDNSVTYNKIMNCISGDSTYDVARKIWGSSWRMPTRDELKELLDMCKWQKTTQGDVKGYQGVGPNGNSIFLPAAGWRTKYGLADEGKWCIYWSSDPIRKSDNHTEASSLKIGGFWGNRIWTLGRELGLSIRPVSE